MTSLVDIRDTPLDINEVVANVSQSSAGAVALFVGVVRDEHDGKRVTRLDYEAYVPMAKRLMETIVSTLAQEYPGARLAVLHRVGELYVGDIAVVCAVSTPHRGEAFDACRLLIDRIKADVPIWKREWGPEGAAWVGWVDARCTHSHA